MRMREKDDSMLGVAGGNPEETQSQKNWEEYLSTLPVLFHNSWGDKLSRERDELFDAWGNYRLTLPKKAVREHWGEREVVGFINTPHEVE